MIVSDNQIDFHFTPKFHQRHINHVPIRPSTRPSRRTWFT
ncbi:conserved hypothetical protein [Burkholderia pseudomallei MSHR346]|uniref:Uncharacterized protein n=1 Tax=Burkholderia pseudomallei 1710a TaxID=320371 RepID=A0A0E1VSQ8_BURPE|nr:conserved hypothetical protein [Burkholderia pseudomallei 576]EEP49190.1 conserved hypothetical protein [Burkholderia pseudomallei MSHR346]EET03129.1 hypothetical protein BURPS1710A_A2661 [Burkholderia pseudomallei 1710a]